MRESLITTGMVCLTIVVCVALMASCAQNTGIF
jgi:hypothetical protein